MLLQRNQSVEAYYHSTYTFLSGLVLELYNSLLFNIHGWVGTQEGDNEEIEDGEGCVLYLPAVWYKRVRIHINPVSWVSYIKPKSHPIFAQSLINLSLGLLYTLSTAQSVHVHSTSGIIPPFWFRTIFTQKLYHWVPFMLRWAPLAIIYLPSQRTSAFHLLQHQICWNNQIFRRHPCAYVLCKRSYFLVLLLGSFESVWLLKCKPIL